MGQTHELLLDNARISQPKYSTYFYNIMKVRNILKDNICLIQVIHELNHQIVDLQFNCVQKYRQHWTCSEDQLLNQAIQLFGIHDLEKLRKILVSKTKKQIYYRIRYIAENPRMFEDQKLSELVQQK
ncbi:SANT/Myb_domain [Hexamita inflata]|uniref:SANT/Myb domain n=1 Tax=Hexamita inflata TaxID=28002 RepID=A0AA86R0Z8_9EUKA|nr:SANT/Myb domain [Hexamita inflata]